MYAFSNTLYVIWKLIEEKTLVKLSLQNHMQKV